MKGFIIVIILGLLGLSPALLPAQIEFGPRFGPASPASDGGTSSRSEGSSPGQLDTLDRIVAVVDEDIITARELETAMARVRDQLRSSNTSLPPEDVLRRQVLERLVLERLQMGAAERQGIVVDDATVNAALEEVAQRNRLEDLSELRQAIEREGFSFAEFREDIRNQIRIARLRQRVVNSRIQVSEQEVANTLEQGSGDREYRLAQILIEVPEGAGPETVRQAAGQAQQVLEQLQQGADFRRLATAVSDGRRALEGGELGWRPLSQMPNLFAGVVAGMAPGQISQPIRSPQGFHIIKVLDSRQRSAAPVTQTRARHILIRPDEITSAEEVRARLRRLRERIINGEDFAALARVHSQDPGSASQGGDLGWVSPGELEPGFEEVMNQL
ncbi:MAG: peptidylprolyl isomerase, partial [Candidatus Competibacteraceae bacterium]|nr:peptidylprolyl isomerase [Candidatus Competibacteraceae bacterium]